MNNEITSNTHIEDDMSWTLPYIEEEKKLRADLLEQLKVGGSEDYCNTIQLFPLELMHSPVLMPSWVFRKFPKHPDFNLDDIEKVAMAHVIHFTVPDNPTGYIECSGHIENWCKCTVAEAHSALQRLEKRKLIISQVLSPEMCRGHKRNLGYFVNVGYVNAILKCYMMNMWN